MKITALEVTDKHATVLFEPCWLTRMLGARPTVLALERVDSGTGALKWRAVGSKRWLDDLGVCSQSEILGALDFLPVADIPQARTALGDLRVLPGGIE